MAPPAAPLAPPSLPTAVPGVLNIALPIEASDAAGIAFGMLPYGYNGRGHGQDGHAGWDFEYRPGGMVRAAANGVVLGITADPVTSSRSVVTLEHVVGSHFYRTVYTNLDSVAAGVVADADVRQGQALGVAGATVEANARSAMSHFQLDDLEFHREGPEPKAVSPEPFLGAPAQLLFARIWATAVYFEELIQPFATQVRERTFPGSRTWNRAGGAGPAAVRFTQRSVLAADYDYALLTESGTAIETGVAVLNLAAKPFPTIDLLSATGIRQGLYDIVSNEMRLTLGAPGGGRPATLDDTQVYRTRR